MVCVMCLIPLFLVPIVNLLPLLFDYLMGKFYGVMGWEYRRKPDRAPPACPYAAKNDSKANGGRCRMWGDVFTYDYCFGVDLYRSALPIIDSLLTEKHEPAPPDFVAESAAAPRAVELKQD